MPAISTNDLKNGITLEIDNGLFTVIEFQHVKPGKGGAFVRTKLRNLRNGNVFDKTFNAGIKVEQAILEKKDMQFLYRDGDDYVFMDTASYDQMHVQPVALGDVADYLVESAVAIIAVYNGEIVSVEIPASVELAVTETEPGVQGDRVSGARKPATV
jgi:elongation factor P